MEINIKNESQQLINNFNEMTGDDKTKAMVVMSTGVKEHDPKLILACAGTASMLLNIQAAAMVETFTHLVRNSTIKQPHISVVELLSNLNNDLMEAATIAKTSLQSDSKQ